MELTTTKEKGKKYWSHSLYQVILDEETSNAEISKAEFDKVSDTEIVMFTGEDCIEIDRTSYPWMIKYHGLSHEILVKARSVSGETYTFKDDLRIDFGFRWDNHEGQWKKPSEFRA